MFPLICNLTMLLIKQILLRSISFCYLIIHNNLALHYMLFHCATILYSDVLFDMHLHLNKYIFQVTDPPALLAFRGQYLLEVFSPNPFILVIRTIKYSPEQFANPAGYIFATGCSSNIPKSALVNIWNWLTDWQSFRMFWFVNSRFDQSTAIKLHGSEFEFV